MYNAACVAALLGEISRSLDHLQKLKTNGSADAIQYLNNVDSDGDFDKIRSDKIFQQKLKSIRGW